MSKATEMEEKRKEEGEKKIVFEGRGGLELYTVGRGRAEV